MRDLANAVAGAGRGPDTTLVHMSAEEVADLNRLSRQGGLGSLPRNPDTGMYEAGLLGDILKTAGSVGVGALGTALGGPLGGALASGLFTGLTEKDLKKGVFAGLGSFMLGKGMDAAIKAGGQGAATAATDTAAGAVAGGGLDASPLFSEIGEGVGARAGDLMSAAPEFGGYQLAGQAAQAAPQEIQRGIGSYFGQLGDAGMSGAGQGFESLMESRTPWMALPMMRSLEMSWNEGNDSGNLERQRADAEAQYLANFGSDPFASLYGGRRFAQGGEITVGPARGGVGPGMDYNRFAQGGRVGEIRDGIRRFQGGGWADDYGYGDPYGPGNIYGDVTSPHDDYNQYGQPTRDADGNQIIYDRQGNAQPRTAKPRGAGPQVHLRPVNVPSAQDYAPGFMGERQYFETTDGDPFGFGSPGVDEGPDPLGGRQRRRADGPAPQNEMVGINPFTMDESMYASGSPGMQNFLSELGGPQGGTQNFGPSGYGFSGPAVRPEPYRPEIVPEAGPLIQPPQSAKNAPLVQNRSLTRRAAGGGIMAYAGGGMPGPYQGQSGAYVEGGMVGPGGGMSDSQPGLIQETGEQVLVSPGEYIIPADVLSMMGDGDTQAGAMMADQMVDSIRMQKTGSPDQLPQFDPSILPGGY